MDMTTFIQHLDYADDICLLAHSVLDVAEMLYSIEKEASSATNSTTNSLFLDSSPFIAVHLSWERNMYGWWK